VSALAPTPCAMHADGRSSVMVPNGLVISEHEVSGPAVALGMMSRKSSTPRCCRRAARDATALDLGASPPIRRYVVGSRSCPPCAYNLPDLSEKSAGIKANASLPAGYVVFPPSLLSRKKRVASYPTSRRYEWVGHILDEKCAPPGSAISPGLARRSELNHYGAQHAGLWEVGCPRPTGPRPPASSAVAPMPNAANAACVMAPVEALTWILTMFGAIPGVTRGFSSCRFRELEPRSPGQCGRGALTS